MMSKVFATLMLPFSWIYGSVMWLRNCAFDKGWLRSVAFPIPVISVGNIRVGGTGKTPMVEYLVATLGKQYHIAVLSRGYGRKSKGFYWVETDAQSALTGDEPLQIKRHFPDIPVAVCEDRVQGIRQLCDAEPGVDLVLLDDAFQHRRIRPYLHLLLTTCAAPFTADRPFPAGRLREFRSGYRRADAVVLTKCPDAALADRLRSQLGRVPVFRSSLEADPPQADRVFGFSGLADNVAFRALLDQTYDMKGFIGFPDHHSFSQQDLDRILEAAGTAQPICTEKDRVKLDGLRGAQQVKALPVRLRLHDDLIGFIQAKLNAF